jgi:hypothetical protein
MTGNIFNFLFMFENSWYGDRTGENTKETIPHQLSAGFSTSLLYIM